MSENLAVNYNLLNFLPSFGESVDYSVIQNTQWGYYKCRPVGKAILLLGKY